MTGIFDCRQEQHMKALEDLVTRLSERIINPPDGVLLLRKTDKEIGESVWDMFITDKHIITYRSLNDNDHYEINADLDMVNEMVNNLPNLVKVLNVSDTTRT